MVFMENQRHSLIALPPGEYEVCFISAMIQQLNETRKWVFFESLDLL
jgi:hypothetical protein